MKNIYIIIVISFFTAIACNDEFLEKYPLDQVNDASFWKTAADIEMYANQFYPALKNPDGTWKLDNTTDDLVPGDRTPYVWNEYTIPTSGGGWGKRDWLAIRSCNYALDRIADMETNEEMQKYEGEIRFFKAWNYVNKVKRYGDVPWLEHNLETDSEDLYKARDSRKVIFTNLLSDLDFAIAHLPEESSTDRLTKYAALAFKAEACLFEGTFRKYHNLGDHEAMLRESVNAAEAIINSQKFSLYTTGNPEEDFFDMFVQYELKGNPEGIMVQRFLTDKRMHVNVRILGEPHTGYSKDFVQSYLCKDGLPIALSPLYQGDAAFDDEFVDRDPRMNQSIYNNSRVYRQYSDGTQEYRLMPQFDNNYCTTSYFIIKGYSIHEIDRLQGQCTVDDFIYRYGRVLIGYAEAKAELGECTQAVLNMSVNKLRDRVGMPHMNINVGFVDPNWPNWEVPVSALINEIRRERRIELCGEGSRWDDITRWKAGKLLDNPLTQVGACDPGTGEYRVVYPGISPRVWVDKLYMYPIPILEITLNPKLVQNPGWI
jgi:starch-binding outer membrane protein, SusD/RagB family